MAEISFNNKFDQMNKLNQQFYDDYFEDNYDPTKPMNQQSNSLTMKSLNDGSTTPDFAAMQSAYNDAQNSKTKNSFFSMSADASMPDNFSGLQNSMGGLTLNPDGTLNYNNTQPQNLGFRSMVDMANNANNFNSQFASPGRFSGMQFGPNKSNMNAPTIDRSNVMGRDLEADDGAQIVDGLTSPYTIRGQLAKDFSKDGIPKDFIDGLRLAGSELNEDFGNIKGKIGTGFDNLKTGIFDNPLTRGAGTALNFLRGNVPGMLMSGLGAIFNRDPNAPSYQQYSPQSYLKENNLSNIYNANPSMINDFYDDNPDSDTFNTTRFDRATTAFGKSRALFGPNGIAATKAKMAAAKAAKAKAYKEKQAADAITAANNPYNPDGSRAAYNYAGRDNAQGTHTSTMSNAQAQANQDRGRGRYNQGGLASMFTRRR
jgi:hypothetical protein